MISRRRLLKLCGMAALATQGSTRAGGSANNTVRVGVIGCGGRAQGLAAQFARIKDVSIVALCDADSARIDSTAKRLATRIADPGGLAKFQDYRHLLDRKDIDAVVIASPNHWHTLHAIHAMQAGKDVYLEKPVSHELFEGRQLVAAEQKYGRMIAAGFQSRSCPGPRDGFQFVREGKLGKILRVHICCFKDRTGIGKRPDPLTPPASVDYNLWLGPAADLPLYRNQFHYDWHWAWNTGNGEIGNQAPHEIDLANWLLGDAGLPTEIRSIGGRFGWNDAGETPNMQLAWYQLAGVPVTIEVDDLQLTPTRKVTGVRDGIRVGLVVHCEGGQLRGGLGGMYAVGVDGKMPIQKFPGDGGARHQANFIDAVRSRRSDDIASRIVLAERAAAIAHLANLSYRAGSPAGAAALESCIGGNPAVASLLADHTKHLADWGITQPAYTVGKPISMDPATTRVLTPGLDEALVHRPCRPEFTVPDLG
ncbi:MAG: Gfo/Idh/MocA family oxidoreductase [Akkermansiaceae bacterium]|nr:Gfo/Idh/MocA family oxidoreductase [Akkermansiaceae bacterium]